MNCSKIPAPFYITGGKSQIPAPVYQIDNSINDNRNINNINNDLRKISITTNSTTETDPTTQNNQITSTINPSKKLKISSIDSKSVLDDKKTNDLDKNEFEKSKIEKNLTQLQNNEKQQISFKDDRNEQQIANLDKSDQIEDLDLRAPEKTLDIDIKNNEDIKSAPENIESLAKIGLKVKNSVKTLPKIVHQRIDEEDNRKKNKKQQ
ncbi:hypothetical protein MHBO_000756 [Bonamia ostreae]|uniref:Uncharacterized protein n=1 Tax=Bonamia ostreae TaxID=126728 RepID=A0ABV2AGP7_9EUKA